MFTGIVTGRFPVTHLTRSAEAARFAVPLDDAHRAELQIGASVALDGVCMTVTRIDAAGAWFDASGETLRRTTLGMREAGDCVHVERSARAGAEVGGHVMSGHVDARATVTAVDSSTDNFRLGIELPPELRRYVFNKGFVGIQGCSLTVVDYQRDTGQFDVWLIPETLRLTNFGACRVGDQLNVEIDRQTQVIVDTVHAAVQEALRGGIPTGD